MPPSLSTNEENGFLVVSGVISPTTGTVSFLDIFELTELPSERVDFPGQSSSSPLNGNLNYSLVQLDEDDLVLAEQAIILLGSEGEYESFVQVIPHMIRTTRIEIRQETSVLESRSASDTPPEVKLVTPNGGESWTGEAEIVWTASDMDGDDLTFDILYSKDSGATWQVIALGLTGESITFPSLQGIPGSEHARVRIIANDGFNTRSDESVRDFSVPDSPPTAGIYAPADGSTGLPKAVTLRGFAFDDEDGSLPAAGLHWDSNVDGLIGMGSEVWAGDLSQGWHTITFTAADSSRKTAADTIYIQVGNYIAMPMITGSPPFQPPD